MANETKVYTLGVSPDRELVARDFVSAVQFGNDAYWGITAEELEGE